MIEKVGLSLKNGSLPDETKSHEIWDRVRKGASIATILALLSGGGLFGCTKPVNKNTRPVTSEQGSSVASNSDIENPIEKSTEDSTTIIIHAGGKTETTRAGASSENNTNITVDSRAEQIYKKILREGGFVPNELRNDLRELSTTPYKMFFNLNLGPESLWVRADGRSYISAGNGALLDIYYDKARPSPIEILENTIGQVLHLGITDQYSIRASESFMHLTDLPSSRLMPNMLVDLWYIQNPETGIVYNATTFMEDILTKKDQLESHVTQLSDLDGNGQFDRVFEGYSLPLDPNMTTKDKLQFARVNGISHELYDLYTTSTFDEVLKKAPDSFEIKTSSGKYTMKVAQKTNTVIEYRLTRDSHERRRGENTCSEQEILNRCSVRIPYHMTITTLDGITNRATISIGEDRLYKIVDGHIYADPGDGIFQVIPWYNKDPVFGWMRHIPGVNLMLEESCESFLLP